MRSGIEEATISENVDAPLANREIKDGVFRLLFGKPENAAELYHALTGIECRPDEIQIITITTTISGKQKNDLAFVVRSKALVVGEHMSSPYANMPVRLLMYTGQLYEKWIKMKDEEKFLYRSTLYKVPTPEFVVFYNGADEKPEKEILRLSDAFETNPDGNLGCLKLEVPVYNINKGMNKELFDKSGKLAQYAEFIAKVRELNKLYDNYTQAVREAANYCITNGILADFLREQGGKIVSILAAEYDVEVAKRVYAEERAEDIAKNALRKGFSLADIVSITGLDEATVKQLQTELG